MKMLSIFMEYRALPVMGCEKTMSDFDNSLISTLEETMPWATVRNYIFSYLPPFPCNQCCGSGSTCFWAYQIRILLSSCKNSKKNLNSLYFVTLFDFLSLKNDGNVASKSNKHKELC
jgi:hypothetical protein